MPLIPFCSAVRFNRTVRGGGIYIRFPEKLMDQFIRIWSYKYLYYESQVIYKLGKPRKPHYTAVKIINLRLININISTVSMFENVKMDRFVLGILMLQKLDWTWEFNVNILDYASLQPYPSHFFLILITFKYCYMRLWTSFIPILVPWSLHCFI